MLAIEIALPPLVISVILISVLIWTLATNQPILKKHKNKY